MGFIEVPLKPDALEWAMRRVGLSPERLAKVVEVKPEKIIAWLHADERPTYRQAKRLAERLHVPFSQLLVSPPQHVELPLPDFRRGKSRGKEPSPELLEAIYDAFRKRDWYREYRRGHRVRAVGSVSWRREDPQEVAERIRDQIPVLELQRRSISWQDFLGKLVRKVEEIGILVLRQSYVGTNTHRLYNPEEFSGFAVADEVAPLIFLNTKDFVARQIFTLAHELVHIWIQESALDAALEAFEMPEEEERERFCNRVAAEFLMPEQEFKEHWEKESNPCQAAQKAAQRFRVSAWAALWRARELGLIRQKEYIGALECLQRETKEKEEKQRGGNFWTRLEARNSPRFTQAVVKAALRNEVSPKEMARLLNLHLGTALDFLDRIRREPRLDHISS